MRGLTAASSWTHLVPGMIVTGVGVGLVNPPLASTAVGVVEPRRAGMASGINSTFRQIGIATGIALLGTLFTNRMSSAVTTDAARTALNGRSTQIASAVRNGGAHQLLASIPPQERGQLTQIVRGGFTSALNHVLLVAAIISIVAGILAFLLIRSKDLVTGGKP
jgi:hypothetical protein